MVITHDTIRNSDITPTEELFRHYCARTIPIVMCQETKEALLKLVTALEREPRSKAEMVYPRNEVKAFFTATNFQRVYSLASCKCGVFANGCASLGPNGRPFDDGIVSCILNDECSFFSVLGCLCLLDRTNNIHRFIAKGYSDQLLHEHPLTPEQFEDLFSPSNLHIRSAFFQFFLPTLLYREELELDAEQVLPFSILRKVGGGAFGAVFEAQILDGSYHTLQHAKVYSSCRRNRCVSS